MSLSPATAHNPNTTQTSSRKYVGGAADLTPGEARAAFQTFDTWIGGPVTSAMLSSGDLARANANLRRVDLSLRTADAINIAIAKRLGLELVTFDTKMAAAARSLGLKFAAAYRASIGRPERVLGLPQPDHGIRGTALPRLRALGER
jgi:hypothetical protein